MATLLVNHTGMENDFVKDKMNLLILKIDRAIAKTIITN